MRQRTKLLGRLLAEAGVISDQAVERALQEQHVTGQRLGRILVDAGEVSEEAVARALARQLGLPFEEAPLAPDRAALGAVSRKLARSRHVVPLQLGPRSVVVAMADPLDLEAVDDLQFQTGRRVEARVAAPSAVSDALDRSYADRLGGLVEDLPDALRHAPEVPDQDLVRATRSTPVVRLVDRILQAAIEDDASDVHVEETGGDVRVRYRIDGVLRQAAEIPAAARKALLSRLKVMAGMDISVRRRAQDGRISMRHRNRGFTLRVSTLPVNGGEKAVVRILDQDAAPRGLGHLGLAAPDLRRIRRMLGRGEGVLLAAGPTGSGKSTTLFAALSELDLEHQNVVTLEDPVEYRLPGANQVQVDRRAGLAFADALRAVLRQDPDVVMVGEIRDRETAEIAMAAAVTGHLVLSTIHTTDAPGAVARLIHMGVPPFLVAGGLTGVIAQRLVRRLCSSCRGSGCDSCAEGYHGRTGVYQVLAVSDTIRDEITGEARTARLRTLARDVGMKRLSEDARRSLAEGLTTPHEISRLLRADPDATLPCSSCDRDVPAGSIACPFCGVRRRRRCVCGESLLPGWRFCPTCIRPVAS